MDFYYARYEKLRANVTEDIQWLIFTTKLKYIFS